MEDQSALEHAIFGGSDSELDLSSEDERPRPSTVVQSQRPRHPSLSKDVDESDDEYVQPSKQLPKFTKKSAGRPEDGERAVVKKKKTKRKEVRREPELAEAPPVLSPEEVRRMELNHTIDAIIKPNKGRTKKRKKGEVDIDAAAEAEVLNMKERMNGAVSADMDANYAKQPATAKLRLLPEVMEVLQKASLWTAVLDQNLLESVKKWLEPLPDKSLPALNIQNSFFEVLMKMDIDTDNLKESGLGRVILFYTKPNKRVTPAIKRHADYLVAQWSRPIIGSSASYRDRNIATAEIDHTVRRRTEKLNVILARGRLEDLGRVRKNAVRIPEKNLGDYNVVPKSNIGGSSQASQEVERRRAQAERLRKMKRKLDLNKQKAARL